MRYSAIIPGQPIGKGRPRIGRLNGHGVAFTPAKTANWEAAAVVALQKDIGQLMLYGPLQVEIVAVFARPKYMMKKSLPDQREPHTKKPDFDNVAKIVCDALQKAGVIRDDCTIHRGTTIKLYANKTEAPCVAVTIFTQENKQP